MAYPNSALLVAISNPNSSLRKVQGLTLSRLAAPLIQAPPLLKALPSRPAPLASLILEVSPLSFVAPFAKVVAILPPGMALASDSRAPALSPSTAYSAASAKAATVPTGGGKKLRAPNAKCAKPDKALPSEVYLPKVLASFRVHPSSLRIRYLPSTIMLLELLVGFTSSLTVCDLTPLPMPKKSPLQSGCTVWSSR